jgi:hypothetical protein
MSKPVVSKETEKEFAAELETAAKLANQKAQDAALAAHGATTSTQGIERFHVGQAWQYGLFCRKAGKNGADYTDKYDIWFEARNKDRAEKDGGPKRKPAYVKDGKTVKAELSGTIGSYNAWAEAALACDPKSKAWLPDYCTRAFALKNVPLPRRAAVVRKLIPLAKEPTDKEWTDMLPEEQSGGGGGATIKGKASAALRSVEGLNEFADIFEDDDDLAAAYFELENAVKAFKRLADEYKKPEPGSDKEADAKAEKMAALRAKLAGRGGSPVPKGEQH